MGDSFSWVQSGGPVTTESIVRFDTWFELFEVFRKKIAPHDLKWYWELTALEMIQLTHAYDIRSRSHLGISHYWHFVRGSTRNTSLCCLFCFTEHAIEQTIKVPVLSDAKTNDASGDLKIYLNATGLQLGFVMLLFALDIYSWKSALRYCIISNLLTILTHDCVTHENHWQIAPLVIKMSLPVNHALFWCNFGVKWFKII